jgi:hypothetical protein
LDIEMKIENDEKVEGGEGKIEQKVSYTNFLLYLVPQR